MPGRRIAKCRCADSGAALPVLSITLARPSVTALEIGPAQVAVAAWQPSFETGHRSGDFSIDRMTGSGRAQEVTNGCFMEAERVELRPGRRAGSENRERQLRVAMQSFP